MPILFILNELISIMSASIIGYQTNKESSIYPPGYETNTDPVWNSETKSTSFMQQDIYPKFQDPLIFSLIMNELEEPVEELTFDPSEIIDRTDDIETDMSEAIAELEREIEKLTYEITYYEEELERLEQGLPPRGANYTLGDLLGIIAELKEEVEDLRQDIETLNYEGLQKLTKPEIRAIRVTMTDELVKLKEIELQKKGECNCSIKYYLKKKPFRRNLSDLSADYQARLANVAWKRSKNPKTGKMSVEIKEWEYEGPAGKVDFDGWLRVFCLLLEMKANYDSLMFSVTESKRAGKPVLKKTGEKKMESLENQAARHNKVCEAHPPARCCWVFMSPKLYDAFLEKLETGDYPYISAIYDPIP